MSEEGSLPPVEREAVSGEESGVARDWEAVRHCWWWAHRWTVWDYKYRGSVLMQEKRCVICGLRKSRAT